MKTILAIQLSDIFPFVIPVLSALVGYFAARKKNEAELRKMDVETDSLELKNVHDIVNFWRDMVKDLKIEVNQLRVQVIKFSAENAALKTEINALSNQISDMHKLIEDQQGSKN